MKNILYKNILCYCYYFFKKIFNKFCGATVSFMLIICSVVSSYVVLSEAACDSDVLWLSCADGKGASPSPKRWRSCKVCGKIGEGEMGGDRGMVMELEGVWNLSRMGMLNCMKAGIGMLFCVLVLVVVVVLVVELV